MSTMDLPPTLVTDLNTVRAGHPTREGTAVVPPTAFSRGSRLAGGGARVARPRLARAQR